MSLSRWLPDRFMTALVAAIVLATIVPVSGQAASLYSALMLAAVALLFFLHGARLSREAVAAGARHWRLHLAVLATTFVLFPLIAWAARPFLSVILTPTLAAGVLYLAVVPSTVQSSIAFTSIAGGNVPAAVCSASLSNILGVVLTPVLAGLLMAVGSGSGVSLSVIGHIALELVLPFALGQFLQPRLGGVIEQHPRLVKAVDQGSIVLVVYGAFSASVVAGLWRDTPIGALFILAGIDLVLLALVLAVTYIVGRLYFNRGDAVVLLFCGSKKTLAGGIPIAKVLFASSRLGAIILPLMLFHQIQLLVCAWIARRYAEQEPPSDASTIG